MTTTQSPNLQLPSRPTRSARSAGGSTLIHLLLVAILGVQAWTLLDGRRPSESNETGSTSASAAAERALAIKLEDRNLPGAAVAAWRRVLSMSDLAASDEAAIHYRMGKLEQQARRYEEAVGEFYRADSLLGASGGDLTHQITMRVRECLQKLGQYSDLSREMAERAAMSDDDTSLRGRQVVAQIGEEKITVAAFDRMLTEQIEQAIAAQVGISDDEAESFRREAHARFADPQARAAQLQQMVSSRVLAAEARQRGLHDSPQFRRQLADSADRLLASRLMLDEVGRRATVTPQDVERYYLANAEQYAEPDQVKIAHILCQSRQLALDVIAEANEGVDFAELARRHSSDESTKQEGGVIAQPVIAGSTFVSGIGENAELNAAIAGTEDDTVLAEPFQSDRGWHAVKVVGRQEGQAKTLNEVRDAVERDVRSARRREVTEQYIRELFTAKGVKFYPGAFTAVDPGQGEEQP